MGEATDLERMWGEVASARELFQHGRPAESLTALREIAARLDHEDLSEHDREHLRARVLVSQASALFEVDGDLDRATTLLDEAERRALGAGAGVVVASVRGQRGLLLLRSGRQEDALAALDEAARDLESADPADQKTILVNRGVLHLERGDLAAARADLEACLDIAVRTDDEVRQSVVRHNLGYIDFLAGRIPRAISLIERASAPHPVALLDRARVLGEAGLVAEADAILARAATAFAEAGLEQDLGETELARAECALQVERPAEAAPLARGALQRFQSRSNVLWTRKAQMLLLRCDRASLGVDDEPLSAEVLALAGRAEELARDCQGEGRRDLAREASLLAAECRLRGGELPADLPRVRPSDPLSLRLQAREVRALTARVRRRHRAATAEVRAGLRELGAYQRSFGSLDLRTASAVHGAALARLGLDLAVQEGSPPAVLDAIERARAVSTRLPQVSPPRDPASAELLASLRRVEQEARGLVGDPAAGDTLAALRRQAHHLQEQLRARAWELEGSDGDPGEGPRSGAVRAGARRADTAFVSYARHRGTWLAVVVAGRRTSLHDLGSVADVQRLVTRARADLDALAQPALPPPIRQAVRGSLEATLARLDDVLVAPLRLPDQPVAISCSGDLLFLPWGLLPSRLGVPTTVAPSAGVWLRGADARRPDDPRVVAVAGPDLRLAETEARGVAGQWARGTARTGPEGTVAATRESLASADLVHVSAHGTHRYDNPLFSAVRLADGQLYAWEIDPHDGLAGCVVLSACDAGLSTTRPGEEVLGLAHVLLQLGVRCVVASVARVNDEVSAAFMVELHRRLREKKSVSHSLAALQRESVNNDTPAAWVACGASW